ncbi:MAG: hypothetical protein AB7R67_18790 [Vicinamibacterales bacterium]
MGEAPRRGEGPATFQSPDGDWILAVIADAIDASMSRKEAAIRMHLDQSQMTKQLQGDGHLSVRRLGALGDAFWMAMADALRARFDLLDKRQLIAQAEALADRSRQLYTRAASL